MAPTRVVYVRHAESTNNDLYARTGRREGRSPDPVLSPLGERQVALAGAAVAALGLGADVPVWASPTARAVQTAAAVVRAGTGSAVELVPDLVEGGGIYEYVDDARMAVEGRPLAELAALAGIDLHWGAEGSAAWGGGFEEHDAIPARAARLVETVRASGLPVVVLVAHEWIAQHVIRAALALPAGNDAALRGWFSVPNASVTELLLDTDAAGAPIGELVRLGDTRHLGDVVPEVAVRLV